MVTCIAPDCRHNNMRERCRFFRIPVDMKVRKKWIRNIRREDIELNTGHFVCQCHFKDGMKENGPTIFEHNKNKIFLFEPPEKKSRKRRKQLPSNSHPNTELPFDLQQSNIALPSDVYSNIVLPSDVYSNIVRPSALHSNTVLPSNSQSNIELPADSQSNIELPSSLSSSTDLMSALSMLKTENDLFRKELAQLQEENMKLREFGFFVIQDREDLITYYTGAQTKTIFDLILKVCTSSPIKYIDGVIVEALPPEDQLLLTLVKLKLNLDDVDLGVRFNICTSSVSIIFLTWLQVLHEKLYKPLVSIILSESENEVQMQSCLTDFKCCRMVIKCTEFFIKRPKKLLRRRHFYSSSKHRPTMKCLIGVSPKGAVVYTSKLFPGSTTDEDIFKHGCLQSAFQPGDLLLHEDKGFLINNIFSDGLDVNIPPFLSTYLFTSSQVHDTTNVKMAKTHVERTIQHIKTYKVIRLFPYTLFLQSTKILQVIVALSNFQPLI